MIQNSKATLCNGLRHVTKYVHNLKELRHLASHSKWLSAITLLFMVLQPQFSMAQTTVTVGSGTSNTGSLVSTSTNSDLYSKSVAIYSASEITAAGGSAGYITKLRWNKQGSGEYLTNNAHLDIYIKGVTNTTHSSTVNWTAEVAGATHVYSSKTQSFPKGNGWVEIILDTVYNWNGTDNIEVLVDWYRPSSLASSITWQYTSKSNTNAYTDDDTPVNSSNRTSSRPNIQFDIVPVTANSAAVTSIDGPVSPVLPGSNPILATIRNYGSANLTSATIGWSVNGVAGTDYNWTGNLATSGADDSVNIGSFNFTDGTHTIKVWSKLPNGTADAAAADDTTTLVVTACNALSGAYTINSGAATGGTNFASFTDAAARLASCGVSGPVIFSVTANSGPYTEQVTFNEIPGASATNTITINGNGNTLTFAPTSANRHVIRLNGADYVTINDLDINATDGTYGWGVHFMNGADHNTISNNTIDIASTSGTTANSGGIIFSGVTNNTNGNSNNGIDNTITGNTITGGFAAVIMYHDASVVSNNRIINNTILDFTSEGIRLNGVNSALIENNDLSRPTNTSSPSTMYMINLDGNVINTRISKNKLHNPQGGGHPTYGGNVYGIRVNNSDATTGLENIISNNLIYDINNVADIRAFDNSGSDGAHYFYNTVYLSRPAAATGDAIGFYQSTSASNIVFKNNIIYIDDAGTGQKNALYFNTSTSDIDSDHNAFYFTPATIIDAYVGNLSYTEYATFADWQAADNAAYDQNSVFEDPIFTDPANADFTFNNFLLNNIGEAVAAVTEDFSGATRHATTPDPGAFEFMPPANDAGVVTLLSPVSPNVPGTNQPIEVKIFNFGSASLTSATIGWSVDGVAGTSYNWTGNLAHAQESDTITVANYNFGTGNYTLKVWTESPNNATDGFADNDTLTTVIVSCMPATGTYTINAALPTSGTNFASFTDAFNQFKTCGLGGNVVVDVASGSGPYNEQLLIDSIPGSQNYTITINGNGNTITYSPNNPDMPAVVRFNGADNITLDSLNIVVDNAASFGWGIHFFNNASSNTISNSVINLPTNSNSNDFVGIVGSDSESSATVSGRNVSGTVFMNNTIIGGYYSIRINGSESVANQIINNTIQDFYYYGIYNNGAEATKIIGNDISRPTRTSITTFHGIYMNGDQSNIAIANNRVHNPFGGDPASTSNAYGISASGAEATPGAENYIFNNIIYNFNGGGDQYGIYSSSSVGTRYYFNTISLDDQTASVDNTTRGFYQVGSRGSDLIFQNNIISVTRNSDAISERTGIYTVVGTAGLTSNNNVIYVNGPNGINFIGHAAGSDFQTLSAWQTAGFDALSISADPMFVNPAAGDYQPSNGLANNIAVPVAIVTEDITGALRHATTPDPGAYEFTSVGLDAGISWISPVIVPTAGNTNIEVEVINTRTTVIDSVRLAYTDGSVTVTESFTGLNLSIGDTDNLVFTTPYNFTGSVDLRAYVIAVNGVTDDNQSNDTTAVQSICVSFAGNYTINKNAAASATNFQSFADAIAAIQRCGVSGPVTFTVAVGSGPYTEQLIVDSNIPGLSAANHITIKGNNEVLEHSVSGYSDARGTILLDGMKHLTIDSLTINAAGSSYGFGIWMTNMTDSVTISNNTINISSTSTSESNSAGIVSSDDENAVSGAGDNANRIKILNNVIDGGYTGIRLNGASATHTTGNVISRNTVQNFRSRGIYLDYADSTLVTGNDISRPTRSSLTTFYGVTISDSRSVTVEKNRIHDPNGSSTFYGVHSSGATGTPLENRVVNNLIYDVNSSGTVYGFYNDEASGTYYYHNTVVLDGSSSSSAYGFYQKDQASDIEVKNNIFNITRAGSGDRYGIYLDETASIVTSDYNVFNITGANANVGYYTIDRPTLADWQSANNNAYGQNSVVQDPQFVNATAANFEPQNPLVNNIGTPLGITTDFTGATRSTTAPDPGAFEFDVQGLDAAISWVAPVSPVSPGNINITVRITNILTANIDSVRLAYTDGTVTETESFTGLNLANLQTADLTFAVPYTFASAANLRAYIISVNGRTDDDQNNDTTAVQNLCVAYAGNLTINSAVATGGTNFQTFADAVAALNNCGVSGPVTITVAPGSGPYNEQITLTEVAGASATNRITINGNYAVLSYQPTTANRHVLRLDGADYITIDSLEIVATDATYGWAVHLLNNADHNILSNNIITVASTSGSEANSLGIVANSGTTSLNTAGNTANNLTIENNLITGAHAGVGLYGDVNNGSGVNNRVLNNTIQDFYRQGVVLYGADSALVSGNDISRPTRSGSLGVFSGVMLRGATKNALVEKNRIHNPSAGNPGSIAQAYGIYSNSNDAPFNSPNYVVNNLIYHFEANGTMYGIYNSGSDYVRYLHNTIALDDTTFMSSSANRYGFYQNSSAAGVQFYNNIVYVTRGGGNRVALYFNTSGSVINSDNNVLFVGANGVLANVNGNDINSLADLQALNYEQNGVVADPLFADLANADFTPTNSGADNVGQPIASVTDDFFGNVRSTTTPDAGAIEFVAVGLPETVANAAAVTAWPNPFTNEVRLQIETEKGGEATITLVDALGRVVMTQLKQVVSGNNPLQLNFNDNLPTGMYLLQVELNGAVSVQKMIKQ